MGVSQEKEERLILLYKGLKGSTNIPKDALITPIRSCKNHHSMAFHLPTARTDNYKESFPRTIRDWNALTDSVISSAESAKDKLAKFTSLARASRFTTPGERMSFDVSPVTILILMYFRFHVLFLTF